MGRKKGVKLTDEHKERIRASRLGKKHSPETIAKISAGCKGREFTEEHKQKLKEAQLKRREAERNENNSDDT